MIKHAFAQARKTLLMDIHETMEKIRASANTAQKLRHISPLLRELYGQTFPRYDASLSKEAHEYHEELKTILSNLEPRQVSRGSFGRPKRRVPDPEQKEKIEALQEMFMRIFGTEVQFSGQARKVIERVCAEFSHRHPNRSPTAFPIVSYTMEYSQMGYKGNSRELDAKIYYLEQLEPLVFAMIEEGDIDLLKQLPPHLPKKVFKNTDPDIYTQWLKHENQEIRSWVMRHLQRLETASAQEEQSSRSNRAP